MASTRRDRRPLAPHPATVQHQPKKQAPNGSRSALQFDDFADEPPNKGGRPPKLTIDDKMRIVRLHQRGASTRQIAAYLSRGRRHIGRSLVANFLRQVHEPNDHVRQTMAAFRRDAIESWHQAMQTGAKYGRHAPAKDWLIATSTISHEPVIDRVTIIVGDGTRAVAQLPPVPDDIDVIATPVNPDPAPDAAPQPVNVAEWPFAGALILSSNPKQDES
jgi:hypothetical protein